MGRYAERIRELNANSQLENPGMRKLELSIQQASQTSPQQAKSEQDLADLTGINRETVQRNYAEIEKLHKASQVNAKKILDEAPSTGEFLQNPNNAAQAQDDIEKLSDMERMLRIQEGVDQSWSDIRGAALGGLLRAWGMTSSGAGHLWGLGERTVERGLDMVLPDNAMDVVNARGPEWLQAANIGQALRTAGKGYTGVADIVEPPPDRQNYITDVAGVVGWMTGQIAGLLLTGGQGGMAMISMQGVSQQADRLEEQDKLGTMEGEAAMLWGGLVTGLTEAYGFDKLLNRLPPKIKNHFLRQLADYAAAGGIEASQEIIEGVLHNFIERVGYNPETGLFDGVVEEGSAAFGGAATMRMMMNLLVPGRQSLRSVDDAAKLDQLNAQLSELGLKQTNKQALDDLIEKIAGETGSESFYLNPDAVRALFQSENLPDDFAKSEAYEQLQVALDTQEAPSDRLEIPMRYLTDIVGTEAYDIFRPHMTLEHDALTPDEMASGNIQKEVERIMALEESEREEQLSVYNEVLGMNIGAGMERSRAETEAILQQAIAATMAGRVGMSVPDFWAKHGFKVRQQVNPLLARRTQQIDTLTMALDRIRGNDFPTDEQVHGKSLIQFLREKGGILPEDEGGEFSGLDIPNILRTAEKGGMSLDYASLLAWESGYIQEQDINALLEAVDREARGEPVYSPENENASMLQVQQDLQELERQLGETGIDLSTMTNEDVISMLYSEDPGETVLHQARSKGYAGTDFREALEWLYSVDQNLDMSFEARMQRARDMGFNVDQIFYHGTGKDVYDFIPGVANAIFVSPDPEFAGGFTPITGAMLDPGYNPVNAEPSGPQIYPVMVRDSNLFDPNNPEHLDRLDDWFMENQEFWESTNTYLQSGLTKEEFVAQVMTSIGDGVTGWSFTETEVVQEFIRDQGFDGFYVWENAVKNIALFKPSDIRSPNAAFDPNLEDSPKILYQETSEKGSLREPWIGYIQKEGKAEHYNREQGEAADWHHSMVVQDIDAWDADDTLRYVRQGDSNQVNVAGTPALDPYGRGRRQLDQMAREMLNAGADPDIRVVVENMALGHEMEGADLGALSDWGMPDGAPTPKMILAQQAREIQRERARRNEIGMYSALEQTVLDMNLPAWKKDGEARGQDIWAKIKSSPVKKEELLWTGIEELLTADPEGKFTRDQAVELVRNNGVVVEETVALSDNDSDGYSQEELYVLEDQAEHVQPPQNTEWLDKLPPEVAQDLRQAYQDMVDGPHEQQKEFAKTIVSHKEEYGDIINAYFMLNAEAIADPGRESFGNQMAHLGSIAFEETDFVAESPTDITLYPTSVESLWIIGGDEVGYQVRYGKDWRDPFNIEEEGIDSYNEAVIQAEAVADRLGVVDERSKEVAQWGSDSMIHPTEGVVGEPVDYREIKLTLPKVSPEKPFRYPSHYPDDNVLSIIRVSERTVGTGVENKLKEFDPVEVDFRIVDNPNRGLHARVMQMFDVATDEVLNTWAPDFSRVSEQETLSTVRENMSTKDQRAGSYRTTGDGKTVRRVSVTEKLDSAQSLFIDETQSDWQSISRKLNDAHKAKDAVNTLLNETSMDEDSVTRVMSLVTQEGHQLNTDAYASMGIPEEILEDFIALTDRLINKHKILRKSGLRLEDTVADAPFKGDAWLGLTMKRAIREAVLSGRTHLAWSDALTIAQRWGGYPADYTAQYDQKMPSLAKKLLKSEPVHLTNSGKPVEKFNPPKLKVGWDPVDRSAYFIDERTGKEFGDERGDLGRYGTEFDNGVDPAETSTQAEAMQEAEDARHQLELEAVERYAESYMEENEGYWVVPIGEEVASQFKDQGMPLFQAARSNDKWGGRKASEVVGDLTALNKMHPPSVKAARRQIKALGKREGARLQKNLERHKGTSWAMATVKSLVYRDALERAYKGEDISDIATDTPLWGRDLRTSTIFKAISKGKRGAEILIDAYTFIGDNQKAENQISSSYINCEPSPECAKFCYATNNAAIRPDDTFKAEFSDWALRKFPERVAKRVAQEYRWTAAYEAGLALRFNDKGDLSKEQVKLIQHLNRQGVRVQVFSKRPELLRKLSDFNNRMLSIDDSNIDVAKKNKDLAIAYTITNGTTAEILAEVNDRVAVYLPINYQGGGLTKADLKHKYPELYGKMLPKICPIDDGTLKKIPKNSFVQIRAGDNKGSWICTACDDQGMRGCFHASSPSQVAGARKRAQDMIATDLTPSDEDINKAVLDNLDNLKERGLLTDAAYKIAREEVLARSADSRETFDASPIAPHPGKPARRTSEADPSGAEVNETSRRYGRGSPGVTKSLYDDDSLSEDGGEALQGDMFVPTGVPDQTRQAQAKANYSPLIKLQATQHWKVGSRQVGSDPAAAAHVASTASNLAQETFLAVILNKKGNVIAVHRHSVGGMDSASVYPGAMVGAIAATPGAHSFWLAHNHPSGTLAASRPDEFITNKLKDIMEGSGIAYQGHVIVAQGSDKFHHLETARVADLPAYDEAKLRVGVTERVFARKSQETLSLSTSALAKAWVKDNLSDVTGVLMLDTQHKPAGFVALSPDEMQKLRKGARLKRLLKGISDFNATAMMAVFEGEADIDAMKNLKRFSTDIDVLVLDGIEQGGESSVSARGVDWSASGRFYQSGKVDTPRGQYDPSTRTIQLNAGADLSTFVHEAMHHWWEVLNELAADHPAIAEDVKALQDWANSQGAEGDYRQTHELIASGFEAYLQEGKAPTQELAPIFARFKMWLTAIYRNIAKIFRSNGLDGATLSEEAVAVMDRLVASEDAIAAAKNNQSLHPLPVEALGLSPEEAEEYQAIIDAANLESDAQLAGEVMREIRRSTKEWWKAGIKDRTERALAELAEQPEYRARDFLAGDRIIEGAAPIKINYAEVQKTYGRKVAQKLGRMLSKDGLPASVVAEQLGYAHGEELVLALANTMNKTERQKWAKAQAEAMMLEEHGDMINDGSLPDQAMKVVHSEKQADKLQYELKMLNRQVGKPTTPKQVFRAAAERRVASSRLRDLRPHYHQRNEAKARNAAMQAAAAGDRATASIEMQKAMSEFYMYKESRRALDQADKQYNFAKSLTKGSRYKRIQRAGDHYINQLNQVLGMVELRKVSNVMLNRRESMRDWHSKIMAEAGEGNPLPSHELMSEDELKIAREESEADTHGVMANFMAVDEILAGQQARNYRELTVDEMSAVAEALAHIDHMAKLKTSLIRSQDKREIQEITNELVDSIEEHGRGKPNNRLSSIRTKGEQRIETLKQWQDVARTPTSLIRMLDGFHEGGPAWQILGQPLQDAEAQETAQIKEVNQKLDALFDKYFPGSEMGKLNDRVVLGEIGRVISRHEALSILLNWGTETGRQRIVDGFGLKEAEVRHIFNKLLTETDYQFAKEVMRLIGSFKEASFQLHKDLYGFTPEEVEPLPFETPYGTFPGGYYPIKYDTEKSAKAEEHALTKEKAKFNSLKSLQKQGSTETRQQKVFRELEMDMTRVIYGHLSETIHYTTHTLALYNAGRIFSQDRVKKAIVDQHGYHVYKQIGNMLRLVKDGDELMFDIQDQALLKYRNYATLAMLGGSIRTIILQPFGVTNSIVKARFGGYNLPKGYAKYMKSPVQQARTIREKSLYMKNRENTMSVAIARIKNRLQKGTGVGDKMRELTPIPMMKMQFYSVDAPLWMAAYDANIDAGIDEETAVKRADQAVRDAQGGGSIVDTAQAMQGGPARKLFTNFLTYMVTTYNLQAEAFHRLKVGEDDLLDFAINTFVLLSMPAILTAILNDYVAGDDDDKPFWKRYLQEQASFVVSMNPVGAQFSGAFMGYDYAGPQGTAIISKTIQLGTQVAQGDLDEGLAKSAIWVLGLATGMPAAQINRTIFGVADAASQEKNPYLFMKQAAFGPER